ncbi:MAG: glycoside hydrolase family 8 [Fibrobacteres bacterium]|nr:glycoside hydrolase family 8 [Fibrobacterota bacterium]
MNGLMMVCAAVLGMWAAPRAQWNLPYVRPAKYDYTSFYSATLTSGLKEDPAFLKSALQKGWGYYKATFIMSNGLVCHRRKQNGQVIGANEAVSEGQGYGMLLAVILNDQATFNRIFEAANQYMWRDDRKSYFIWNWPSGGQGSATDADIDVGMALVFADELQKKKLWQPYSKGGVDYHSRAMDIIRSIRKNMTSQDYLLPGDNWGGDGLNNLNPSYFATANMKVFDAYQTEVDFRPVIATSYAVLRKCSAQYQKGQAPDWITKDGTKGPKGNDMLDDGIRAPYRIGLDALWSGDATAQEFCRNSRTTLSEYANADSRFVLNQMGLYKSDGSLIAGTSALDHMAMWSTAVLASGDKAYSSKVLGRDLILRLVGDGLTDGFGSTQLGEIDYYYKQSLGLLGFAAITGQFPNVLEDMKGDVVPVGLERPTRAANGAARVFQDAAPGAAMLLFGGDRVSADGRAIPTLP